jgi:hypothetical protein
MTLKNPTTATTAIAITTTEDIPKINDIVFIFYICFFICQRTTTVAEAQGFEPQVPSQVRLISNQIHSTTLSNLLMFLSTQIYHQRIPLSIFLIGIVLVSSFFVIVILIEV